MDSEAGPWQVLVDSAAAREIRKLSPEIRTRVRTSILRAASRFPSGDAKRLKGDVKLWRLRVGGWRILLEPDFEAQTLTIRHVHPRDKAYRN